MVVIMRKKCRHYREINCRNHCLLTLFLFCHRDCAWQVSSHSSSLFAETKQKVNSNYHVLLSLTSVYNNPPELFILIVLFFVPNLTCFASCTWCPQRHRIFTHNFIFIHHCLFFLNVPIMWDSSMIWPFIAFSSMALLALCIPRNMVSSA